MPWQQMVADVGGEIDPATGLLWYREVVVTVMRQQGKTTLQLPWMVDRCISWPTPQHVTYAAQSGVAARDKLFDEHWPMLERSPLRKAVTLRRTSGHEALLWRNGSRHTITAGKETSGHGMILDGGVIDEAFAYPDARLEQAFLPAMQTRPDPQMLITSTAGYDEMRSPYLWGKVRRGRELVDSGASSKVAYFEWSFADDDDPYDPETWRRRMPALGQPKMAVEAAVQAAAESMEEPEFLRAFGNLWGKTNGGGVFAPGMWEGLTDPSSAIVGQLSFAVDMTPDRARASIAVAGLRADGLRHVEVVESRNGTRWVADRLSELVGRHGGSVLLDPGGPAGGLIPSLAEVGIEVLPVSMRDYAQACGNFYDLVASGGLRHLGQQELNEAVAGATKRLVGDAWLWNRKHMLIDISPLVAVSLAVFAVTTAEPEKKPVFLW
jgi:hypothetical protein